MVWEDCVADVALPADPFDVATRHGIERRWWPIPLLVNVWMAAGAEVLVDDEWKCRDAPAATTVQFNAMLHIICSSVQKGFLWLRFGDEHENLGFSVLDQFWNGTTAQIQFPNCKTWVYKMSNCVTFTFTWSNSTDHSTTTTLQINYW